MTTVGNLINIAAGEVGYAEHPPGSNGNKYGQWYGMNYVPWCAIFISYCFDKIGLPLPVRSAKGFAYCPDGVSWFRQRGQWFQEPKVGDVVFFCWRGDGIADHIGIVESVKSDGSIISIEGNTGVGNDANGGQVMRRTRTLGIILGFGRPPYTHSTPTQAQASRPATPAPAPPQREVVKVPPNYHKNLVDQLIGKKNKS
ncbi:MAG: CHAP domain-containing protein [Planktothrix sp.]